MARSASSKSKSRSRGGGKDIISTLPDETLSHILSFLPTIDAVITSTLSQRWRYIWTLVPTLDFDDSREPDFLKPFDNVSFVNFVDRVLNVHRDLNSCIQKFYLNCCLEYNSSHFNTWICGAIACGVSNLDVTYFAQGYDSVDLSGSLFTCEMLEVLKLSLDLRIRIPDLVLLPRLRVLHLISVPLIDDSRIEKLIRSCPVLEELVIEMDSYDSLTTLKIRSSSLKSLTISRNAEPDAPEYDYECSLDIDAQFLEYLHIADPVSAEYNVSKLSSLVMANINIWQSTGLIKEITDDFRDSIELLFREICHVKHLTTSTQTVASIYYLSNRVLPTFWNLTHLEVKIQPGGWDCNYLLYLLKCTPQVTHLAVEVDCYYCRVVEWESRPDLMVKCLSTLEMIEIRGFRGCPHVMEFAKHFLENSMVLKKMTICSQFRAPAKELAAIKKLLRFPRGSRICEVVFS